VLNAGLGVDDVNGDWLFIIGVFIFIVMMLWNRVSIFLIRERVSVLEHIVGIDSKKCYGCAKQPFPFDGYESPNNAKHLCEWRLDIVATRDNDDFIITVGGNRNVLSTIPIGDLLCEFGKKVQTDTPNAVLTGAGHDIPGNGAPYHRVRLKT
jgi:hypothetical protein